MATLFDTLATEARQTPLAERLRPKSLEEVVGQESVLGAGCPLRNLFETQALASLILWGPPGVGKTTLARLVAHNTKARFIELSAVSSGITELRQAVTQAQEALKLYQEPTVVFIDEIHRYSKTQQDALLPYVEDGTLILMGSTTENPSFQVIPALLSRVLIVRLNGLSRPAMETLLQKGLEALPTVTVTPEARTFLVDYANGDGRSLLNLLELAAKCAPHEAGQRTLEVTFLEQLAQQSRLNYDRDGDAHYDHASAYQKSLRGSDADAAIYWLAKMIASGEDPRFIARRLLVTASEDVGNADPIALVLAMAAFEAVERLGLPEARIPLAQATIYVAQAPKSNQAIVSIDQALADIRRHGKSFPVPMALRDSHYQDAKAYGHGTGYCYSHDMPYIPQTFLPEALVATAYVPPR